MVFRDITKSEIFYEYDNNISEGIKFNGFDTTKNNMYLISRNAPTPEEKEQSQPLPYMQGKYDFSFVAGYRFYNNREVEYSFKIFNIVYEDRKIYERYIKQHLMNTNYLKEIYDTHNSKFHWFGKCKSITVEDSEEYHTLIATITFDCYPFLISNDNYFDDVWDTFNFLEDIAQLSKHSIENNKRIVLINGGSNNVPITLKTNSDVSVLVNNKRYNFSQGTYEDALPFDIGVNYYDIYGNTDVELLFYSEVMG